MKQPEQRTLDLDWLDTLKVVKEAGFAARMATLYARVRVVWCEEPIFPAYRLLFKTVDQESHVRAEVSQQLTTMFKVERVEILSHIATMSMLRFFGGGAEEQAAICKMLGCADTRLCNPRERWRRIIFRGESLIHDLFEDRPECGWCKGNMATGSASALRPDMHEGCYQYIMTTVRPRLVAAKLQEEKGG